MDLENRIESLGIVPVIKLEDSGHALALGDALIKGGLPIAEVTFRTAAAEASIRILSEKRPEILVGAGTVLSVENADKAIAAGAKFIVAPGFNPEVVDHCIERNIPIFPGINSPSQIEMGLSRGLNVLKFFPAETSGGLKALKAMAAAYGQVRFMPTGGISPENIGEYLQFDKILACGGSWMVKPELIASGAFEEIARLSRAAVFSAIGFKFAHIGINSRDEKEAGGFVNTFASVFGMDSTEGNSSFFIGREMEIVKSLGLGEHGHLAIKVNRLSLAKDYLERSGLSFRPESAKYKDGRMTALFLKEEFNGYAVHLLQA